MIKLFFIYNYTKTKLNGYGACFCGYNVWRVEEGMQRMQCSEENTCRSPVIALFGEGEWRQNSIFAK